MKLFDANSAIGPIILPYGGLRYTASMLLSDMEHFGIEQALVYHLLSKDYSPEVGNSLLMEETSGCEGLIACWVVMPHHAGDTKPPAELMEEMRSKGVRAVRLFPRTHNFSLSEWCCGELLCELESRRIPLFIDLSETNFDELKNLASLHPRLPVVLCSTGYRLDRFIYPLFSQCLNLYLEISMYPTYNGVESFCCAVGAERLLFGTGVPRFTPGSAITNLSYANITDEQKERIASRSLLELLGMNDE